MTGSSGSNESTVPGCVRDRVSSLVLSDHHGYDPCVAWDKTIVIVEQNISAVMRLADRIYIITNGHIVEELPAQAVYDQPELLYRHVGI
jgi:hypothetical protein